MDRILLVVTIAFLYSSTSLATDEDRSSRGVQYTQVTYHENGFDGAKPTVWMGKYGQLTNEDMTFGKRPVDDLLDLRRSAPGTGIGMGVAPLFGSYGVFRTSSNPDKPAYLVLGFT